MFEIKSHNWWIKTKKLKKNQNWEVFWLSWVDLYNLLTSFTDVHNIVDQNVIFCKNLSIVLKFRFLSFKQDTLFQNRSRNVRLRWIWMSLRISKMLENPSEEEFRELLSGLLKEFYLMEFDPEGIKWKLKVCIINS